MSNSMSNSMSNPGSSMSNVVINGNLDIDDVLTVVTSRAERSFNVSLAEAKSRIANLTRDIKNKTDEISKRRKQECLDLVAAKVDGLRAGVEAIGGKVDVSDCCKNGAGGDLKLGATITIKHASIGGYGRFASFDFEGEPSKVLLAMMATCLNSILYVVFDRSRKSVRNIRAPRGSPPWIRTS